MRGSNSRDCYLKLACSISSFGIAFGSIWSLNPSDKISLHKGAFLTSLGLVYFVSLTEFLNKFILETPSGLKIIKKYRLRIADVLDITNKLVSTVQACFSCAAGLIVCRWSCTKNFLQASHFMSECYAWFGAAYFFYDMWSMYTVYAAATALKIKGIKGSLSKQVNDVVKSNGKKLLYDEKKSITNDDIIADDNNTEKIPSLKDGNLSLFLTTKSGLPSFAKYIFTHPIMIMHHLFIGSYGLYVITSLRGNIGDCIFSFIFLMELSTPFVSFRSILSILGLKQSKLYVINGIVMLATFFLCRIVMMPYVMYWYSEVVNLPYFQAFLALPRGCKISMSIILLPQIYWFYLMMKGATKLFFVKKGNPTEQIINNKITNREMQNLST